MRSGKFNKTCQTIFYGATMRMFGGIAAVMCMVFIASCGNNSVGEKTAAEQVHAAYVADLAAADSATSLLVTASHKKSSLAELRRIFKMARLCYKKVEFLGEYYNPETAHSINGAAIESVEEDDPVKLVAPEGFQVVEELLFATDSTDYDALVRAVKTLYSNIRRLGKVAHTTTLTDPQIFDALRLEMHRIVALGITGFDSPIAEFSIAETISALGTIGSTLEIYQRGTVKEAKPLADSALKSAVTECRRAASYCEGHSDFGSFNRTEFITHHTNPLGLAVKTAQIIIGIPEKKEVRPLSGTAATIFDADAWSPEFYAPEYARKLSAVDLGEALFFDPVLSGNGSRSCATCHQPERAFTDGLPKSAALGGGSVARNAPTLLNAGLQSSQFYDQRVAYLEDQATEVIANPAEMHGSLNAAAAILTNNKEYAAKFEKAFPAKPITGLTIRMALAAYVRSLTRLNSRFDRFMRGEAAALSPAEQHGFNLFAGKAKCATCHFIPLFNGSVPPYYMETEAEILGVPAHPDTTNATLDPDEGKFRLRQAVTEKFAFKTPTLRNIALTAPYMHNGVYATLEQVVDFYNRGGGRGIGIKSDRQTLPDAPLGLSAQERGNLVAFLQSLTDTSKTLSRRRPLATIGQ